VDYAEVVIRINDQPNGKYLDGDIVEVFTQAMIDQEVAKVAGDPQWAGHDPTLCPMSDTMLSTFLVLRVLNVPDAYVQQVTEPELHPNGDIKRKRQYKVDWQADLGLTQEIIDDVLDPAVVVDVRLSHAFDVADVVKAQTREPA
jgi:hypothetical protein